MGSKTNQPYLVLEEKIASWQSVDPRRVVVCSSGTAALHLSLETLKLKRNEKIIIPDFTMIACARAVTLAQGCPILIDCTDDLLINTEILRESPRALFFQSRAIMPVHIYGRKCDMYEISEFAKAMRIEVIEDMAEAPTISPHPDTYAACWSFYRNKIIAGEEGGAILFRDPYSADFARRLRSLGFDHEHDFTHCPRGHNYRLANSLASLILTSLNFLPENLSARRGIESAYDQICPLGWKMPKRDAPWVYDIRIRGLTAKKQNLIVSALVKEGIPARHAFKPISSQEEYCSGINYLGEGRASILAKEIIYLPLTDFVSREIEQMFRIIKGIAG